MSNGIIYLKENEIQQDKKQNVFVIFMSMHKYHIYKKLYKSSPRIAIIMRDEGKFGFPGGGFSNKDKIDITNDIITSNDLKRTAKRECMEEIGYDLDETRLKFHNSILNYESQITNYIYILSDEEMDELYKDYNKIIGNYHNYTEVCGLNVIIFKNENVVQEILKQNFKYLAKSVLTGILEEYC